MKLHQKFQEGLIQSKPDYLQNHWFIGSYQGKNFVVMKNVAVTLVALKMENVTWNDFFGLYDVFGLLILDLNHPQL